MTFRCCKLPYVGQLLVDQPGRFAAPSPVCSVLHKLRGYSVCLNGAQARGASRLGSKFLDGAPRLAARVRDVEGIDSLLPSLLLLLFYMFVIIFQLRHMFENDLFSIYAHCIHLM